MISVFTGKKNYYIWIVGSLPMFLGSAYQQKTPKNGVALKFSTQLDPIRGLLFLQNCLPTSKYHKNRSKKAIGLIFFSSET